MQKPRTIVELWWTQ